MNAHAPEHRAILQTIARWAMVARGLLPDFSNQALAELDRLAVPPAEAGGALRDLRDRPCAPSTMPILSTSTTHRGRSAPSDRMRIWVAVADVDGLVKKGGALDEHARRNTTTVYTPPKTPRCCPKNFLPG